jgi:hypothetical protein
MANNFNNPSNKLQSFQNQSQITSYSYQENFKRISFYVTKYINKEN